ncbi:MAG: ATP-dependent Lon protease [Candidatus Poribacteria bacterium]|nr:ATP-dependent Lon protease [Candidatus Poribacteria bacterium]
MIKRRRSMEQQNKSRQIILPVLPLPEQVMFPNMTRPLHVVRERSVKALKYAIEHNSEILMLTMKEVADNPDLDELYEVGTIGRVLQSLDPKDGSLKVFVSGILRAKVIEILRDGDFTRALLEVISDKAEKDLETQALMNNVVSTLREYVSATKKLPPETMEEIEEILSQGDPILLADTVSRYLSPPVVDYREQQAILDMLDLKERLEKIIEVIKYQIQIYGIEKEIDGRIQEQVAKQQKEFYLNERIKAIHKELGRDSQGLADIDDLKKKIQDAKMTKEAEEKAFRELERLEQMPPMSAESGVIRNYIDWLISMPWDITTETKLNIDEAEKILEEDHYGLEKPKERILEYLAVLKLVQKIKGPILCFVGPPGVGKTSLAKSIARATGRNFIRVSLGGVRDEAEIRGHRRTYIGSMPGRVIQGLKKAKSRNPLFLLDEVDKMSMDFRGDPSAALLEVFDPEQNHTFNALYLDVDFDLSEVLFITTANYLNAIPPPLRDRMEIHVLPGYTEYEKQIIAELFLIPKQLKANGLSSELLSISKSAVSSIINLYTREAGVRNLEREIASVCRKVAKKVVKMDQETPKKLQVNAKNVHDYLGISRFTHGKGEVEDQIGVATGLAYTEMGGDVLAIEVTTMDGNGSLVLTGKLGDIMQESAKAALSYIRSRNKEQSLIDIPSEFYAKHDIHVHIPEGAVPKDGPSAGITVATAMISAFTGTPVRKDIAMTGEITLRGRVLPIGGLKEKVLAALRADITNIIIPRENEKDLSEIPLEIRKKLSFHLVDNMDKVIELALKR